jgi:hypothetical protein
MYTYSTISDSGSVKGIQVTDREVKDSVHIASRVLHSENIAPYISFLSLFKMTTKNTNLNYRYNLYMTMHLHVMDHIRIFQSGFNDGTISTYGEIITDNLFYIGSDRYLFAIFF